MWDVMEVVEVIPRYVDVPRCYAWPMTFHTIRFTADKKSFAWVTDRYAHFEAGAYGTVMKIEYLPDHNVAYSLWGDEHAMDVAAEFAGRVKDNKLSVSNAREAINGLYELAKVLPKDAPNPYPSSNPVLAPRGLLVAHISDHPQVYRLSLGEHPRVNIISDEVSSVSAAAISSAGDPYNPAISFLDYYGRMVPRATLHELLLMGVQMLRVAASCHSRGIRGIDAWVCENGVFRQLTDEQVKVYIEASERLDDQIQHMFRNAPPF